MLFKRFCLLVYGAQQQEQEQKTKKNSSSKMLLLCLKLERRTLRTAMFFPAVWESNIHIYLCWFWFLLLSFFKKHFVGPYKRPSAKSHAKHAKQTSLFCSCVNRAGSAVKCSLCRSLLVFLFIHLLIILALILVISKTWGKCVRRAFIPPMGP